MNLAPWNYRNILSRCGGPIRAIHSQSFVSPILHSVYEAHAELDAGVLSLAPNKNHKIYGNSDGSGTSIYSTQARYKAISEALERWAFYELAVAERTNKHGFDQDASTTGMAAFPGLTSQEARDNAFYEAVERWSLAAWWEGKLAARLLDSSRCGLQIDVSNVFKGPVGIAVVVLWHKMESQGLICYGFSCASNLEKAIQRASVELDRNRRVLSDLPAESEICATEEKRLVYFSRHEGQEVFQERVRQSLGARDVIARTPPLITNGPIVGKWTKYCHVWRCLFEPVSERHSGEQIDYFLF